MDLAQTFRKTYLKVLGQTPGIKVLVLDDTISQILSVIVPNSVNAQMDVSATMLISNLTNVTGQKMSWAKAVLFIEPSSTNLELLTQQLTAPMFGEYWVNFTSEPTREQLERLARADRTKRVVRVRVLFGRYAPVLPRLFHTPPGAGADDLRADADSLMSTLLSAGRMPFAVRHSRAPRARELCGHLHRLLAQTRGRFVFDENGRPPADTTEAPQLPLEVIVLDRADDPLSPLVTSWTFLGILSELCVLGGGKVTAPVTRRVQGLERHEEMEFAFNPLIDPSGIIADVIFRPFQDAREVIKTLFEEMARTRAQIRDGQGMSLGEVHEVVLRQDRLLQHHAAVKDLHLVSYPPLRQITRDGWADWALLALQVANNTSKAAESGTGGGRQNRVDLKGARKLVPEILKSDAVLRNPYVVVKLVLTFALRHPELEAELRDAFDAALRGAAAALGAAAGIEAQVNDFLQWARGDGRAAVNWAAVESAAAQACRHIGSALERSRESHEGMFEIKEDDILDKGKARADQPSDIFCFTPRVLPLAQAAVYNNLPEAEFQYYPDMTRGDVHKRLGKKQPHDVLIFIAGGVSYHEYAALQVQEKYARKGSKLGTKLSEATAKHVLLGGSEVFGPRRFLERYARLRLARE
eukprot:gnl/Chilomastix_cuspidata/1223.p1 GENE.gnl/Chilomastix_cuspidata/1223~~gnl/Chilomastix_cuspidata/1223.p1  ORF type:complete len:639 (+),score=370.17 gnl/Chilomastix_cuspidata/1223:467-2383(+)